VIYHETIDLFKTHCKSVQNNTDVEGLIRNQKVKADPKERVKITKQMEPSYANACKAFNNKIDDEEKSRFTDREIADLLAKVNARLPDNYPDRDNNEIEYILKTVYKKSELTAYYTLAKEYRFEFKEIIYEWVKKLIILIHNIK
jgi:hypothetical protein